CVTNGASIETWGSATTSVGIVSHISRQVVTLRTLTKPREESFFATEATPERMGRGRIGRGRWMNREDDLRPIKPLVAGLQFFSNWGFVLLIITLPWSIAPMSIGAAICGLTTLLLWILPGAPRPRSAPVDRAALGWLVAMVLAATFAVDRSASFARLGKGLFPALVPLAAFHASDRRRGQLALACLLFSSAAASVFGMIFFVARGAGFSTRARGPVGHYMTFGGQLLLLVALAVAIAMVTRSKRWRAGAIVTAALGAISLAAT